MIRVLRFIFGARLFPRHQWSEPFTIGSGETYQSGGIVITEVQRTLRVCNVCGCTDACGDLWRCVPGRWFH